MKQALTNDVQRRTSHRASMGSRQLSSWYHCPNDHAHTSQILQLPFQSRLCVAFETHLFQHPGNLGFLVAAAFAHHHYN
jgi:hypothetical protein